MTETVALSLIPLLSTVFRTVKIWSGEKVDYNLDRVRELGLDYRKIQLARLPHYCWPLAYDLSRPVLAVEPLPHGRIVINCTNRYRNWACDYRVLRGQDCLFLGHDNEYGAFSRAYFACEHIQATDYLHAARLIAGSRYYVGSQSSMWWVSECLKVRRVLEVSPDCPNSSPVGPLGWDCWTGSAWERVHRMLNESH